MLTLPFWANSGQYSATGACTSSWPRSTRVSAARAVTVFVIDQTFTIVSLVQGTFRARVAESTPDVYDGFPVQIYGYRGAEFLVLQVALERRAYTFEPLLVIAVYLSHAYSPSWSSSSTPFVNRFLAMSRPAHWCRFLARRHRRGRGLCLAD